MLSIIFQTEPLCSVFGRLSKAVNHNRTITPEWNGVMEAPWSAVIQSCKGSCCCFSRQAVRNQAMLHKHQQKKKEKKRKTCSDRVWSQIATIRWPLPDWSRLIPTSLGPVNKGGEGCVTRIHHYQTGNIQPLHRVSKATCAKQIMKVHLFNLNCMDSATWLACN